MKRSGLSLHHVKVIAVACGLFTITFLLAFIATSSIGYFIFIDTLGFAIDSTRWMVYASLIAAVGGAFLAARQHIADSWDNRTLLRHQKTGANVTAEYKASPFRASRVSTCWSCKRIVTGETHTECIHCGWYVCDCGACRSPDYGGCAEQYGRRPHLDHARLPLVGRLACA